MKKSSTAIDFWFVNFSFWIFEETSKFWAASLKNESNLLLVRITVFMGTNRNLFRRTVLQNCRKVKNCSLDYCSWENIPTFRNPNQNSAALWRIFSTNKSAPANRKKGFYTNHRDPNNREVV
jgi:hypothetical protein